MKILLVITGLYPGGAEKIVLELARNLSAAKNQVLVVSLLQRPPEPECTIVHELEKLAVPVYFLKLGRDPAGIVTLLKLIRRERPDVVHSHLMHANLAARFVRLFCRFPLVNTVHIAERRKCLKVRILFLLDQLTFRLCDIFTAVSHAAGSFHEQRCALPQGTLVTVLNGSDPVPQISAGASTELRKEWGLDDTEKIIGSVGRLDWQKGYDLFLQTLPELRPLITAGKRWGILLIGDGPEKEKLTVLAAKIAKEIPELKIVLAGYRPDAASLISMMDLFVMPSRYEGFGLTLTEALSAGVPCLCSKADSLPELCALVPDHTLNTDFVPGAMRSVFEQALRLSRFEGKMLRTTAAMTAEYYGLYTAAIQKQLRH